MTNEPSVTINEHREKLMDYVYQELSQADRLSFEEHLKGCQLCQRDLADFMQLRTALASWELEGVPYITVKMEHQPSKSWLDLFNALPLWMRLLTTAAAVVLVMALFNVSLGYHAAEGFQFSASLFPRQPDQPREVAPPRPGTMSEQQIKALIETTVHEVSLQRNQEIAAHLEAISREIRSDNQSRLLKLAESLRQEQEDRFLEAWYQAQHSSFTTLTELLSSGTGQGY